MPPEPVRELPPAEPVRPEPTVAYRLPTTSAPQEPPRVHRDLPLAEAFPQIEAFVREMRGSLGRLFQTRRRGAADRQQAKALRVIIGLAMLTAFLAFSGRSSAFFAFAVVPLVGLLALVLGRTWISATSYEVRRDPMPRTVTLGQTLVWGGSVRARKALVLKPGRVVLRCQEHAIRWTGKRTSHHRHTIYEQAFPVGGRSMQPDDKAEVRAEVTVPASGVPSYPGQTNRIEWTLSLEAPVEGICRNIKETVPLAVLPIVVSAQAEAAQGMPSIPADHLAEAARTVRAGGVEGKPLSAVLFLADGRMAYGVPAVSVGETREFRVRLEASKDINCRGVWCWIGCRLHGRGADEEVAMVSDLQAYDGALRAGQPVEFPVSVRVPAAGPVSYRGRCLSFEWSIRVRMAIPMWRDRHLELPFVVTPRPKATGNED